MPISGENKEGFLALAGGAGLRSPVRFGSPPWMAAGCVHAASWPGLLLASGVRGCASCRARLAPRSLLLVD